MLSLEAPGFITTIIASPLVSMSYIDFLDCCQLYQSIDKKSTPVFKIDKEKKEVIGAKAVIKKVAEKRPHWVQSDIRKGTPSPRGASSPPKAAPKEKEPTQPLVNF